MVQRTLALRRMLSLQVCPVQHSFDAPTLTPPRRIATYFTPTTHWRTHDIFSRQKLSTFASSRPAVLELAARYSDLLSQLQQTSTNTTDSANAAADTVSESDNTNEASRLLFTEVCEICLWGNATDLSLLTNLTYTDIQALQGSSARKSQEANILVNDLPSAFSHLLRAQAQKPNAERRVDIVLDNAGFELFVDLVLAGYLLEAGLATQIVLHPKSIPWFVSDVTLKDFGALLNALADPQRFYRTVASDGSTDAKTDEGTGKPLSESEEKSLKVLFEHWSTLHAEGRLVIRPNRFWTHAGSYWRMPTIAPELYRDLQESELVIFKGDLNYRKLTGDCAWDVRTGFQEAIGPLAGGGGDKGLNVLALRTCKADVVVGLGEGVDERVKATEGGGGDSGARRWAWSGKWALVQSSLH